MGDAAAVPKEAPQAASSEQCAAWASNGECARNPEYMLRSCAAACAAVSTGSEVRPGRPLSPFLWAFAVVIATVLWVGLQRRLRARQGGAAGHDTSAAVDRSEDELRDRRLRRFKAGSSGVTASAPEAAAPTATAAAAVDAGRGGPREERGSGGADVRRSWQEREAATRTAAADSGGGDGSARGPRQAGRGWSSLFRDASHSEGAIARFGRGGCALLVWRDDPSPSSLHLAQRVWTEPGVVGLLGRPETLALRIRRGDAAAAYWESECDAEAPAVGVFGPSRPVRVLKARQLPASAVARELAAAVAAAADGDASDGDAGRAAAMLGRYAAAAARGFRPPTPPPAPEGANGAASGGAPPSSPSWSATIAAQDEQYALSLHADQMAEEAEEQAEQAAIQAAIQEAEAEREAEREAAEAAEAAAARRREREARAAALPVEPPAGASDATVILARLRDGGRAQRRFPKASTLRDVFSWLSNEMPAARLASLATSFPRRELSEEADGEHTLEGLGLHPAATLFVQELESDDESS